LGAEVRVLASHVVAAVVLTFLRLVAGVTGTAKAHLEKDCVKEATMAKARTVVTKVGVAVKHSILESTLAAVICGVAQLAEHQPGA
jgi:hypothetical protein